jgi:16S rRNA pseudouridine516 synthase
MTKNIRLDRLLSNLGYGSRKDITHALKQGALTTQEGQEITDASQSVALENVRAGHYLFDGKPLDPPSPLTIMLHKPKGYTCSHNDAGPIVYDLLPYRWRARKPVLSCVGRLDKDSTGQLLLTDDGDFLHRVIHPKSHAPKHYSVRLRDPLRGDETEKFATGNFRMIGDDKPLKPALWTPSGPSAGTMILSEGRYHQIRRMFETLGNEVVELHRFQTGQLALEGLAEGTYKLLTDEEKWWAVQGSNL